MNFIITLCIFLDLAYQGPYSRASTDHEKCSSDKSQHHLYGHHINQFEIETFNSFSPRSNLGESFKKKQHFIHGRVCIHKLLVHTSINPLFIIKVFFC